MKKLLILALVLALMSGPAFAITTKAGTGGGADEAWVSVKVPEDYPTLVSRGHVLVYHYNTNDINSADGLYVRHAFASTDESVAGVAQKTIASGETTLILAKGRGVVNYINSPAANTLASGDALGVHYSTAASTNGTVIEANTNHLGRSRIGVAAETQTGNDTQSWAFINVL